VCERERGEGGEEGEGWGGGRETERVRLQLCFTGPHHEAEAKLQAIEEAPTVLKRVTCDYKGVVRSQSRTCSGKSHFEVEASCQAERHKREASCQAERLAGRRNGQQSVGAPQHPKSGNQGGHVSITPTLSPSFRPFLAILYWHPAMPLFILTLHSHYTLTLHFPFCIEALYPHLHCNPAL